MLDKNIQNCLNNTLLTIWHNGNRNVFSCLNILLRCVPIPSKHKSPPYRGNIPLIENDNMLPAWISLHIILFCSQYSALMVS